MSIGMLSTIIGLLFSGFATTIVVALYRRGKERREHDREDRIAQRAEELDVIFEHRKAQYAKSHPKSSIVIPTEQEYRKAIASLPLLRRVRSKKASSILEEVRKRVESRRRLLPSKIPQMLRLLLKFSTPKWKRRLILKQLLDRLAEVLNELAKELW